MTIVNIRRDVDDKFYRYRMPLLETKIEGKGNGIKTVIPNMSDIARALSRPPSYPTKFFGSELGAQTILDEKNDRYIVNGAHDATRLRELLDGFIDKFVLCGECKNPETDLKIRNGEIIRDCKACGKRTYVDMRHKLTTFILKNPPPKRVKGAKGAGAASGQTVQADAGDADENAGSDDELTRRINAEAKSIPTAEQREKDVDADEDWSVDTSEAAVAARVKALEGAMNVLGVGDDDEGEEDESSPYAQFGTWILEEREKGKAPGAADVYRKAQELGIEKKHKSLQVLFQALFSENAPAEVERYAPLLLKMVTSEKHQKAMLGGIERLAGLEHTSLVPNGVPKLLMALYQIDVLDEDVVSQWGTHVSKKYVDKETSKRVRKAAAPFLEWLEQAESDDEDDEDEDEDDEAEEETQDNATAYQEGDSDLDDL
ncbi:eukaryotic translation initiation factor 5 [Malassezia pachydermatis]|uniref:Eukaryotic translation initiation factor 5 n=1 Tax=Malassezia pachydermatis TaxID=77020 RepID=A0A0M9VRB9_9BASI|nr:eukaryotic translation initiation factor 5 [Malassezia pachydermatis]KOS16425.1 eukaryotic translation initiation factor 5 [Malassezia pachydermatis]